MARLKRNVPKRTAKQPLAMPADMKALRSDLEFTPRKMSPASKPKSYSGPTAIPPIQRATKKPLYGKYPE